MPLPPSPLWSDPSLVDGVVLSPVPTGAMQLWVLVSGGWSVPNPDTGDSLTSPPLKLGKMAGEGVNTNFVLQYDENRVQAPAS